MQNNVIKHQAPIKNQESNVFGVKKRIVVFLTVIYSFIAVQAQGEIDFQPTVFYRNEWSIAAMLNSNGFGANYRYGKRIDAANKRLFEVDFAYMKDPKEKKSYGIQTSYSTPAKYVHGKKNLAFDFRFGYGKQHEIYRKHDLGGIAIRYFYNFGPSAVLLKPIYYDAAQAQSTNYELLPPDKFDPKWEAQNIFIVGRASFFKGFAEIRPIPGAFAKFGFNFDFGKQDRIIHALETGLIAEGFMKKIEILDFTYLGTEPRKVAQNQQFFLTLFVSYRFGRIVDPYEVKKKRERSREISY